jgi:hypothetical protein
MALQRHMWGLYSRPAGVRAGEACGSMLFNNAGGPRHVIMQKELSSPSFRMPCGFIPPRKSHFAMLFHVSADEPEVRLCTSLSFLSPSAGLILKVEVEKEAIDAALGLLIAIFTWPREGFPAFYPSCLRISLLVWEGSIVGPGQAWAWPRAWLAPWGWPRGLPSWLVSAGTQGTNALV